MGIEEGEASHHRARKLELPSCHEVATTTSMRAESVKENQLGRGSDNAHSTSQLPAAVDPPLAIKHTEEAKDEGIS